MLFLVERKGRLALRNWTLTGKKGEDPFRPSQHACHALPFALNAVLSTEVELTCLLPCVAGSTPLCS